MHKHDSIIVPPGSILHVASYFHNVPACPGELMEVMSSVRETEATGRELFSELTESPVDDWELFSELTESPADGRELFSELSESPISFACVLRERTNPLVGSWR